MTSDVILEKLEKFVEHEEKTMTREKAIKSLHAAGIVDKKGNLTEPYRGLSSILKPVKAE